MLQRTLDLTRANTQLQTEIAQRQQAEEKLTQSEQHFRALIENSYDAISLLGPDGLIHYASPSTQRILGYSPTETVGGNPAEGTHPGIGIAQADISKLFRPFVQVDSSLSRHYEGSGLGWCWF